MSGAAIPTVVLGGSGYVAGELLRLLAGHPRFRLAAAVSESRPGTPIAEAFPHLAGALPDTARFASLDQARDRLVPGAPLALLSALPHGHSAATVDRLLGEAEARGADLRVVDLSADFRLATAAQYEAVYKQPHPAPARLAEFVCALPEHRQPPPRAPLAHPGCFTTAVTLATVPLVALGLIEPEVAVSAITGSTGAGRAPTATTHHPERRSNLFAYSPLGHRHEPEMRRLVEDATGVATEIAFVPHSGPFARGIHATLHARLVEPLPAEEVGARVAAFYAEAPFVRVGSEAPRLQAVVGSNFAHLGFAVRGRSLVAFSVLDNLVKGAAGGALQWLNRLFDLPESAGLAQPGIGWL